MGWVGGAQYFPAKSAYYLNQTMLKNNPWGHTFISFILSKLFTDVQHSEVCPKHMSFT